MLRRAERTCAATIATSKVAMRFIVASVRWMRVGVSNAKCPGPRLEGEDFEAELTLERDRLPRYYAFERVVN